MQRSFFSILAAVALTGCASVPQTEVKFNPKTGDVTIASPKNTRIMGFKSEIGPGTVKVSFDSCATENDPSVIAAVAQQNAAMADKALALSAQVVEMSVNAAKKGAVK